ncbi:MAG: hypothetical protein ABIJ24_05730 [Nitrospinota bacterium]|nr:hypothetical protein [Nitrospinota bacterium]
MFKRINIVKQILILSFFLSPSLLYAETEPDIPYMPQYILHYVSAGETLHDISGYYLATPRRWREIYQLNKDKIDNTERLRAGVGLIIPMINEPPPYPTMEKYRRSIGTLPDKAEGMGEDKGQKNVVIDESSLETSSDNNKEVGRGTLSVIEPPPLPAGDEDKKDIETPPDTTKGAKE